MRKDRTGGSQEEMRSEEGSERTYEFDWMEIYWHDQARGALEQC